MVDKILTLISFQKMKNRKTITLIILITSLATNWSCIEEVTNVNLPSMQPKLVVNTYISPGDSIDVKVYKSRPLFNEQDVSPYMDYFPPVLNAVVTISDENGNQKSIPLLQQKEIYSISPSQFIIEEGKTYSLTVSAPGLTPANATTTIPDFKTSFLEVNIDTVTSTSQFGYNTSEIVIWGKLEDQTNLKNYYRIMYYFYENGYLFSQNDYNRQVENEFFSDAGSNDGKVNFKFKTWFSPWDSILIVALNTDYNYYTYHKSMLKFETGNPFAEPIPVYSNIDKGLGVFGSFIKTQIVVKPNK
jgi:hypothetical protein